MKVNCDLGEHPIDEDSPDEALMPYIDMANIACGGHAGDEHTMAQAIELAVQQNVLICAHPSYPDKENFGRLSMAISEQQLKASLTEQITRLYRLAIARQASIYCVKPHGALYNDMMQDEAIFNCICQTVAELNQRLNVDMKVMAQALVNNKVQRRIGKKYKLDILFEAFADRAVLSDGRLQPRTQHNAVITDRITIKKRLQQLVVHGEMTTVNSEIIDINADTVCCHGDNPNAVEIVSTVRDLLTELNEDG
ncbi:5-oxoprolinase subunit PxpA [Thalassotalea ponticola]|uniref:5-oxoprolinase subunit PxpA n=1 Tax=Thalassotalea ponticola TaxID=1523392 RepID=UPI0025B2AE16|nr:5-oxoprolinase subunit PxpA [Thalassotalea ponticola]MDN3653758.1 5-oxoprolinase subunit PxpA [Thalassotalea ponticola]